MNTSKLSFAAATLIALSLFQIGEAVAANSNEPKPTKEQAEQAKEKAVRHIVRLVELAAASVNSNEQFINELLSHRTQAERTALIGKNRGPDRHDGAGDRRLPSKGRYRLPRRHRRQSLSERRRLDREAGSVARKGVPLLAEEDPADPEGQTILGRRRLAHQSARSGSPRPEDRRAARASPLSSVSLCEPCTTWRKSEKLSKPRARRRPPSAWPSSKNASTISPPKTRR